MNYVPFDKFVSGSLKRSWIIVSLQVPEFASYSVLSFGMISFRIYFVTVKRQIAHSKLLAGTEVTTCGMK